MTGSHRTDVEDGKNDIEFILNDIGGTFGRFQIYTYLMLSVSMFVTGTFVLDYVFSTLEIDHRCFIAECEGADDFVFKPNWLEYSTPFKNGRPSSCQRFESIHNSTTSSDLSCEIGSFNRSLVSNCVEGPMLFRTDELSIVNEFNLTCDENRWKIAMVGTWSNIGRLIFLPIAGWLSDRFGRKTVLVYTTLLSSIFKLLKSFAPNYTSFVVLEMFDAGISSAIYPAALILAMEMSTSEQNILVSNIVLASYPFGQVFTAGVASYLHDYKWLLRVIGLIGIATFPFIWILPESLRWLLVNRKNEAAVALVEKAAKMNGLTVSPKTYDIIQTECSKDNANDELNKQNHGSLKDILLDCALFTRLAICAFCWISSTFITYGVSILSVSLKGDKYVNFMVVSLGAAPSVFLTYAMLLYARRRWSMCVSLLATGLSILASKYFSSHETVSLIFFFLGKLFINHAFAALYLYTNEMWPTVLRHSVMGICSMIGRFGSIAAPLVPLLIFVSELLPFYLFSAFAFLSAIMILFLPETFRQTKLPDSINDIKKM